MINQDFLQTTPEEDTSSHTASPSTVAYIRKHVSGARAGAMPTLLLFLGLFGIVIFFGSLEPAFFSPRNFVNLLLQMAGITTLAIGVVFVLLIAEIDLSTGYVSAVGGVITALLLRQPTPAWHWLPAITAGLICTTLIGFLQGLIITKARVPSFVVTLAGLLGWSGVVLILTTELSTAGVIVIQDPVVLAIANAFLTGYWSVLLWIGVTVLMALWWLGPYWIHRRRKIPFDKPLTILLLQVCGVSLLSSTIIWVANQDRGVPLVTVIVLGFLIFWSFVANQTRFGRYVYAVGNNPQAVRRAGIDVNRVRVTVFMIAGFMAGAGGIILASRLRSVDTNSGGGNLLLLVIAAAVIGGTSLFGGRGSVFSALMGALIIAALESGMGLLGWPSGVKFVVTALVLLAAVLIDSFSRHAREESGLY